MAWLTATAALYTEDFTLYTLYSVHCILYIVHCILHTVHFKLYAVYGILNCVQSTVHCIMMSTVHCTVYTPPLYPAVRHSVVVGEQTAPAPVGKEAAGGRLRGKLWIIRWFHWCRGKLYVIQTNVARCCKVLYRCCRPEISTPCSTKGFLQLPTALTQMEEHRSWFLVYKLFLKGILR